MEYRESGDWRSWEWVPCSATLPSLSTKILSQCITVDSLWAMMMEVRPLVANFRALMIDFSVMESRLEVASSNTSIGVSFRTALRRFGDI